MASAVADGSAYDVSASLLGAPLIRPPLAQSSSSQVGLGTDTHTAGPLVPINLPGPIQIDLLQSVSQATVTSTGASDESVAETGRIDLLNLVHATALRADARAFSSPKTASYSTAGSEIEGLTIAGTAINSIYPNEVIPLPGGGTVTLLEQTSTTGSASGRSTADLSINLIHIRIPGLVAGVGATDIIVGHAEAHADSPLAGACPRASNGAVSAEAFAAEVTQGLDPQLNTIKVNDIAIPSSGGSDSTALQAFTVTLSGKTIGSGTVYEQVNGATNTSAANASANATVEALCLLTTTPCDPAHGLFPTDGIGLSAVTASSYSAAGGKMASSYDAGTTIATLTINGSRIPLPAIQPNSVYSIPGVATIILDEQIGEPGNNGTTDSGLTVNAIHIRLLIGGADIIISSAHSDAHHR